jgi:hypothetical protein
VSQTSQASQRTVVPDITTPRASSFPISVSRSISPRHIPLPLTEEEVLLSASVSPVIDPARIALPASRSSLLVSSVSAHQSPVSSDYFLDLLFEKLTAFTQESVIPQDIPLPVSPYSSRSSQSFSHRDSGFSTPYPETSSKPIPLIISRVSSPISFIPDTMTPQPIPIIAMTGLAALPMPYTDRAPKQFTGNPDDIEDLLDRYDSLAIGAQLSDADKVKGFIQYADRRTKEFLRELDGYDAKDWDQFEKSIRVAYGKTDSKLKYTRVTLETLVAKNARNPVESEEDVMTFYRNFLPVANWLVKNGHITEKEKNHFFFWGFPAEFRERILSIRLDPTVKRDDPNEAYHMTDVIAHAKSLLNPLHFEHQAPFRNIPFASPVSSQMHHAYRDTAPVIKAPQTRPSIIPEEDDDDEYEYVRLHKNRVATSKAPRTAQAARYEVMRRSERSEPSGEVQEVVTKKVQFQPNSVEDDAVLGELAAELSTLRIEDSKYAVIYAHLKHKFPDVAADFPSPRISGHYVDQAGKTVQTNTQFVRRFGQSGGALSSNSGSPSLAQQAADAVPGVQLPRPSTSRMAEFLCHYCKEVYAKCKGINNCVKVEEDIRDKKVIRTERGVRFPDGSQIPPHEKGLKYVVDTFEAKRKEREAANAKRDESHFFMLRADFLDRSLPAHSDDHSHDHSFMVAAEVEGTSTDVSAIDEAKARVDLKWKELHEAMLLENAARITRESETVAAVTRSQAQRASTAKQSDPSSSKVPPDKPTSSIPVPPVIPRLATTSGKKSTSHNKPSHDLPFTPASEPAPAPSAPEPDKSVHRPGRPPPQYQIRSKVQEADDKIVDIIIGRIFDAPLQLSAKEMFALSPKVRSSMIDFLRERKIPVNLPLIEEVELEEKKQAQDSKKDKGKKKQVSSDEIDPASNVLYFGLPPPAFAVELRDIDVMLPNNVACRATWDTASSIVVIRKDYAIACKHPINVQTQTHMTTAGNTENTLVGTIEHLPIKCGSIMSLANARIVDDAPYALLLGLPWIQYVRGCMFLNSEDTWIASIVDPLDRTHEVEMVTHPHGAGLHHRHLSSYVNTFQSAFDLVGETLVAKVEGMKAYGSKKKYKPVAKKVRPVPTSLPEEFRVVRRWVGDPFESYVPLSPHPTEVIPTGRLTLERWERIRQACVAEGFSFEEIKLVGNMLMINEAVLAGSDLEIGHFREDMYPPIRIGMIEHIPWQIPPIPIPPGIFARFKELIEEREAAGIYEESNASYRSPIFAVPKQDGDIRLVHEMSMANSFAIKNSGQPPNPRKLLDRFTGKSCLSTFDLYGGYSHRALHPDSRDVTTFQAPGMRAKRVTVLIQGHTVSMPIFSDDVNFLLQPVSNGKIEGYDADNFVDDIITGGPDTRYELEDKTVEVLEENPEIRRYIWEHLNGDNALLTIFRHVGVTVAVNKLQIAVGEAKILGFRCSYEGRAPERKKIDKIKNWPIPENLGQVRSFMGVASFVRQFIRDFARIASPLTALARKDAVFEWTAECQIAMDRLKELIVSAPRLQPIDYGSNEQVYLSVDTSAKAVGWILSQFKNKFKKRTVAYYGSKVWNAKQAGYTGAKAELYGLHYALHASRIDLIGLAEFIVEMDAQAVIGMINRPDINPNATINRWISVIKCFNFKIVHVRGKDFKGPDALSRRPLGEGEEDEDDDDIDDYIDKRLNCLGIWVDSLESNDHTHVFRYVDNAGVGHFSPQRVAPALSLAYTLSGRLSQPDELSVKLPRSDKTIEADQYLDWVFEFLKTADFPKGLDKKKITLILGKAKGFFVQDGRLWRRQPNTLKHQLVVFYADRVVLLLQAHDRLGHKGIWSTTRILSQRFYWPSLEEDVAYWIRHCHECQLRQTTKIHIPPSITIPVSLFSRIHIDTMNFPAAGKQRVTKVIQARCALTGYPEYVVCKSENLRVIKSFLFKDIICRYGAIAELVADNAPQFQAALKELENEFSVNPVAVSSYNSQAQGIVERSHRSLRDAVVKTCEGNISLWPIVIPYVVWADRCTIRKSTGLSPFEMVHGVEPVLPFDITLATFLAPKFDRPISTDDLIATRARQLMRREGDLEKIKERVIKARYASIAQFEKDNINRIRPQIFEPGTLVLVRNIRAEKNLSGKHLPRYFGPMQVIARTRGGAYRLGELDGAISKTRYAAFRLIEYRARDTVKIPITMVYDKDDLEGVLAAEDTAQEIDEVEDLAVDADE